MINATKHKAQNVVIPVTRCSARTEPVKKTQDTSTQFPEPIHTSTNDATSAPQAKIDVTSCQPKGSDANAGIGAYKSKQVFYCGCGSISELTYSNDESDEDSDESWEDSDEDWDADGEYSEDEEEFFGRKDGKGYYNGWVRNYKNLDNLEEDYTEQEEEINVEDSGDEGDKNDKNGEDEDTERKEDKHRKQGDEVDEDEDDEDNEEDDDEEDKDGNADMFSHGKWQNERDEKKEEEEDFKGKS
ncbi:prostatic spermine-binding protein-like [Bacillus rossius redtenbacheri]|uniref:prostatic spermine-binding protein-like n=1 Tax=Bacillus rossius redtenbacheri TaxID=93214 RepID=UPI002FDE11F0